MLRVPLRRHVPVPLVVGHWRAPRHRRPGPSSLDPVLAHHAASWQRATDRAGSAPSRSRAEGRMRGRGAAAVVAVALTAAGCASVTAGTGSGTALDGSTDARFPSVA